MCVLGIPLSKRQGIDRIIWHYNKHGTFTVKSGYFEAIKLDGLDNGGGTDFRWSLLWSINLPPRVKDFIWRAIHNVIPTKTRLGDKGVVMDLKCHNCDLYENLDHVLFNCIHARGCWQLWNGVFDRNLRIEEVISSLSEHYTVEIVEEFCFIAWGLWSARNSAIWKNEIVTPSYIYRNAERARSSWRHAINLKQGVDRARMEETISNKRREGAGQINRDGIDWICTVDAAIFEQEKKSGFGFVIRKSSGQFVYAVSGVLQGVFKARIMESMAIREVLAWIKNIFNTPGIIYSDCQEAVRAINSDQEDLTEFGLVVDDCRNYLKERRQTSIVWINRQDNKEAHMLARAPLHNSCLHLWNVVPNCICSVN